MKIVNRGFLIVSPKQPFFDWANNFEEDIYFDENDEVEPTIYLIEEDFIETEHVIKSHYKKIFLNELNMVTENVDDHPKISEELFHQWFHVIEGTTVLDALQSDLKRFDID
ncbi:MAG: hypothetical protein M9916_10170 [Crocinitomicaceae bacterium]|nr:hypothetical protein [Crocinitomicaceae bacterium]